MIINSVKQHSLRSLCPFNNFDSTSARLMECWTKCDSTVLWLSKSICHELAAIIFKNYTLLYASIRTALEQVTVQRSRRIYKSHKSLHMSKDLYELRESLQRSRTMYKLRASLQRPRTMNKLHSL